MTSSDAGPALPGLHPPRLTRLERAWAERLFAAILAPQTAGLPRFESVDRAPFWAAIDEAPGPLFGVGLRAMIHLLTFLPLTDPRHHRPFFLLPEDARIDWIEERYHDGRFAVRQAVYALKMLACFAWFDAPHVRAAVAR